MKIQKTIWVEDYVLEFYTIISDSMGDRTPEELMAEAVFHYAGMVADNMNRLRAESEDAPLS